MLAITFRSSPAASMNSASICSVKVERTPAMHGRLRGARRVPGEARRGGSRRSLREDGARPRGSHGSRGLSQALALLLSASLLNALLEKLPENGLQDTAVPEVLDLYRRVHPRPGLELPGFAVVACGFDRKLRTGFEVCEASDVVGLLAGEAQRLGVLTVRELEGQDAHPDQVGAVDA